MKNQQKNEPESGYYGVLIAEVRLNNTLTFGARVLYAEIASLCSWRGYCWAGNKYMAKQLKVTNVSISKWIKALEEHKHIKIEREPGLFRHIYITKK